MAPIPKPKRRRRRHFIKEWRKFRALTQEQVAERIGMSATNFGRIENGKVPYDQDFLEMAAYALQCEPWDLIERDPTKEGDVVDLLEHLPDDKKQQAETFIRYLVETG